MRHTSAILSYVEKGNDFAALGTTWHSAAWQTLSRSFASCERVQATQRTRPRVNTVHSATIVSFGLISW